jgi:hypothetical protein
VRRLWYAGAVAAGGMLLIGAAAPASADPGSRRDPRPDQPAAQVVDGTLRPATPLRNLRTRGSMPNQDASALAFRGLFGGGLPLFGGLLPNGGFPSPTWQRVESSDGSVPLLGGVLPLDTEPGRLPTGKKPTPTGLPAGGKKVPAKPKPAAAIDDPRLLEEPLDTDEPDPRPFSSGGRPIAGIDEDYK